ncbi:hypothetical protein ERHA55_06510 [Erwinia rhapontici]|uniref:Uncharacterized protein n=1 Tax=Erwinia rhapontici TaxID=55212 RepID=A0ABM7MVT9_ERWRD|nr:hypothetical protein [Erwinia rhapontici]BCQ33248.1 hypothetical protein ERHA53_05910 [Erwinia rhapontici]BCQ43124.1 hypothetical protein ERHA55_06510 [Erwinia rhapontici]
MKLKPGCILYPVMLPQRYLLIFHGNNLRNTLLSYRSGYDH